MKEIVKCIKIGFYVVVETVLCKVDDFKDWVKKKIHK